MKSLKALFAVSILATTSACSYLKVEVEHVSHPFAGFPFGPPNEEDYLNVAQACLGREGSGWYVEHCLGYKIGETGFYGPKLSYIGRVGRKFDFKD